MVQITIIADNLISSVSCSGGRVVSLWHTRKVGTVTYDYFRYIPAHITKNVEQCANSY